MKIKINNCVLFDFSLARLKGKGFPAGSLSSLWLLQIKQSVNY